MNGHRTCRRRLRFLPIAVLLLGAGTGQVPAQGGDALPAGSPSQLLARARALEAERQYPPAIAAYRAYLAARPEDDEARAALARLLAWQRDYDAASLLYQDILSRHPVDLDARTALARVNAWQGRYDEARRLYQGVLAETPDHPETKRGLADTLFWSGNPEGALRYYRELLAAGYEPDETRQRIRQVEAAMAEAALVPLAPGVAEPPLALPYRDYLKLGFGFFGYTGGIADERDWLLELAKPLGDLTLVARGEALNRFGETNGQLSGELYSPLWEGAWGYAGASAGVDPTFVADWALGGELYQGLGAFAPALSRLELSLGYRHLDFASGGVDILVPGVTVYLPKNMWITERLYYVPDTDAWTLSSQITWRPGRRAQFQFSGAFGTASERVDAVQDVLRTDTTSLQAGAMLPLSRRLSLEAWGFYEDREDLYRRRGGALNLLYHW